MNIKIKNRLQFVFALMCISMFFGCNGDILDQVPKDQLSEELVWTDPAGATQFINAIYGEMPSGFDRDYDGWAKGLYILDGVTDDGNVCMPWTHSNRLETGNFLASGVPFGQTWGHYYWLIRKTNVALENLDRLEDETLRKRLKGETYFLRAFIYHELLRLYGLKSSGGEPTGVPIIDRSLTLDDNLQIPRDTYDDVVDLILSDLDNAASMLPKKGEIENGRATYGAAYALKSRVLLYDERWSDAAIAAKEVMGAYSLYPDYKELFLTKNTDEVIFAKKFEYPDKHHHSGRSGNGWDAINSPPSIRASNGDGGWGGNVPTQNFVDAYDMIDGKPQSESALYDPQKPFDNLDPRFEATVVYNGAEFRGRPFEIWRSYDPALPNGIDVVDRSEVTKTGYVLRKYHVEDRVIYSQSSDQDWIFLRYAEVLLNYAEAQNEAVGPDASVYNAINQIRKRASVNMPDLPAGLGQSEMREKIRNERRIELAFEEHRFFDIRRWKIAQDVLDNKEMMGMEIIKNADGTFTYTKKPFETRTFPSKLYVLPIPQGELDKNPEAKQINGW